MHKSYKNSITAIYILYCTLQERVLALQRHLAATRAHYPPVYPIAG